MSDLNPIFGWVASIEPPLSYEAPGDGTLKAVPREVVVHFTDERKARLTPEVPSSDVHLEILEQRWKRGAPVYVEVDSEARIHQLRLPFVTAVADLTTTSSGEVEVELELSHARHVLNPSNYDFRQLLEDLRRAKENDEPIIVVETPDDHEIIGVMLSPTPLPWTRRAETPEDRSAVPSTVDPGQARRLFRLVAASDCGPLLLQPLGCIPFLYPDDGCMERAHEMCRLILEERVTPAKIWIVGDLRPLSNNHPTCAVRWSVHVAPFLDVRLDSGEVQKWVIDPALFSEPRPKRDWIAAQRDPAAAPGYTHHSVFSLFMRRSLVLTPATADDRLAPYRELLRDRIERHGSPPYRSCP